MEVMDVAQVVQVGRAKSVMRTKQLKGGMRGPPGAGGGSVASLRHMPTPSLSTLSSLTSSSPYPGVSPEDILRLEKAFSVEGLVRQIADIDRESDSSDYDSDVLLGAESEARRSPLTYQQVLLFDKSVVQRAKRRYINEHLQQESDDNVEDDSLNQFEVVPNEEFEELFRSHLKRKKLRKKIRANPELHVRKEKVPVKKVSKKARPKPESTTASRPLQVDESKRTKNHKSSRAKRKQEKAERISIEQVSNRRKKLWLSIVRKETGKAQKSRHYLIREKVTNSKRIATQCMRAVRQKALMTQRNSKEVFSRAKRLTREMQVYWRKFDRVERQQKRQLEKEAEEQEKLDLQLLEAKRQQRKLNFLITQTELYAHFIANKIGMKGFDANETAILDRLDETPVSGRLAEIDSYNAEEAKNIARTNAAQALESQHQRISKYNINDFEDLKPNFDEDLEKKDHGQPSLFHGTLKNYQIKGMNWLINLYDQGINGILADEMGLGKTVQSIATLAHIAEHYNIWGPFLVITPASTLHNWQQEVSRFLPAFKVVPYWGSPQERKVLRHFWDQANLHTRSASFHVVITSYQLVVTDFKYFNRIKWQYLVLDEAQAIKSSSSQRWKMLLEFKCRNRLLLSGTPIQNSMAELWSLLHFVMPTLFDSHEEFNDWFSKDIESSAENKSQIDQKQISRLHMILKPFMLRRIKKDVENELTDKLEVLLYCPLTTRQKLLYMGLKKKIRIEDLLQGLGSQSQNSTLSSSLMNLVMQFRKVCNHPELFERREARSPFVMDVEPYIVPKLIFHENINSSLNPAYHLKNHRFSIFHPQNLHETIYKHSTTDYLEIPSNPFSFLRFVDTSLSEVHEITFSLLARWIYLAREIKRVQDRKFRKYFLGDSPGRKFLERRSFLIWNEPINQIDHPDLVFTRTTSDCVFSHSDISISYTPETMRHRIIRSKHSNKGFKLKGLSQYLVPEFPHISKPKINRSCQKCYLPKFLLSTCPKVATNTRTPYTYDRSAAWKLMNHQQCSSPEGYACVTYGAPDLHDDFEESRLSFSHPITVGGVMRSTPPLGWSNIIVPDKETLVFDAGKLFVLDGLLDRLKSDGHRVLIYSQMTKMIDLLEEYMTHRKHTYIRLDGSSKIHERRDMVADFQERSDIFVFLLSTRAGGLGINLTAADTVIFYDSDWNPTVDQQAMDRAHRLGQTKQVTVYRLICKGTIEERILQRAREKSAIQEMVIQGRSFMGRVNDLKPKEVVSLLLDDEEIERKYREQSSIQDKKRKLSVDTPSERMSQPCSPVQLAKKLKMMNESSKTSREDESNSYMEAESDQDAMSCQVDPDGFSDNAMSREPTRPTSPLVDFLGEKLGPKRLHRRPGAKRGRPKGSSSKSRENNAQCNGENSTKRGPGRPKVGKPIKT